MPRRAALPSLDVLIRVVDGMHTPDELAELDLALGMANALSRVGDELVGHYVDKARQSGIPWARIGERLGTTKQAAQQRFPSAASTAPVARVAEVRFPRQADYEPGMQDALRAAVREVERLGHPFLGTEHMLLGLLAQTRSVASRLLHGRGVDIDSTRRRVTELAPPVLPPGGRCMGTTRRAERVLDIAQREVRGKRWRRGSRTVSTEHLLLALALERDGLAARILAEHGVDDAVIALELNGLA